MKFFPKIQILILILLFCFFNITLASDTDGTIDSSYKYAWGQNTGWVNFGTSAGNVHITDSGLSGYAWSDNYGWINLNPSTSGVKNNSQGVLSGYAWGEKLGWINFSGVMINSSGQFIGQANGDISGQINFDCANCIIKTDWRPLSSRTPETPIYPAGGGIPGSTMPTPPSVPQPKLIALALPGPEIIERLPEILRPLMPIMPGFLKPKPPEIKPPEIPLAELVPKEAPLVMKGHWNLLPAEAIGQFVLAPLPRELTILAQKFPQLEKTLSQVGISKMSDIERLKNSEITLPGLARIVNLPKGVPIAQLPPALKGKIPTEIVFSRAGNQLIDFNILLSINDQGQPEQRIETISGKQMNLAVKPERPVKRIRGYIVFKANLHPPTASALVASAIFSLPSLAQNYNSKDIEQKLVLAEFEYTDPDRDGIYTADVNAPAVDGEYEIITVMDYEDVQLGSKMIRMVAVVDPEGYIYTNLPQGELRVTGAIVSLYWLNQNKKQYQLWPAKDYQQENPQVTDITGKYSFLVPEGDYYLKVEAPGYLLYEGKPFLIKEGSGIHVNIELRTKNWWLHIVDWKTILLVMVTLLLLYNFYRDKIRERWTRKSPQSLS